MSAQRRDLALFKRELAALMRAHDVSLGCEIEGDTHGISERFVIADGHGNELEVVAEFESFLYARDLEERS